MVSIKKRPVAFGAGNVVPRALLRHLKAHGITARVVPARRSVRRSK